MTARPAGVTGGSGAAQAATAPEGAAFGGALVVVGFSECRGPCTPTSLIGSLEQSSGIRGADAQVQAIRRRWADGYVMLRGRHFAHRRATFAPGGAW